MYLTILISHSVAINKHNFIIEYVTINSNLLLLIHLTLLISHSVAINKHNFIIEYVTINSNLLLLIHLHVHVCDFFLHFGRYFIRGKNALPADEDFVAPVGRNPRLRPYDKLLKAFQYKKALDSVLKVCLDSLSPLYLH